MDTQRDNSIGRSISILSSLAEGRDRIVDICSDLDLNKSTVHRLLKNLEAAGFVYQDPLTRRYFLGPALIRLSIKPLTAHQVLIIAARSEMERLRDVSQETIVLHIRTGLDRICISEFESPQQIKYTAVLGSTAPIYTGSAGKALLAEVSPRDLRLILGNLKMEPVGPNTITDRERLLREIELVKRQGYAVSAGERLKHAFSVSVAIKNYICPVALSLLGPENRLQPVLDGILPEMRRSADIISAKIQAYTNAEAGGDVAPEQPAQPITSTGREATDGRYSLEGRVV